MSGFSNMKAQREDVAFIVVLIVYAIIRFFEFTSWSLTNDELSALVRLNYNSISELITLGIRDNDMHPMGVQLFLWCWTGVFGMDEWIVRLPFVLFGIGALVFIYRAATVLFGKPSALLTVSLFAFLQFPAMYAELARPYSPGLFFSMLMLYGWIGNGTTHYHLLRVVLDVCMSIISVFYLLVCWACVDSLLCPGSVYCTIFYPV
jgi:uncharacterized membrane protein